MTDKLRQAAEMVARELKEFTAYGYMYDGIMLDFGNEVEMLEKALAEPPNSTTDVVESEPVACGMQNADGQITDVITPEEHDRVEGAYTIPLYTVPPKREWQGLTDGDIAQTMHGSVEGSNILPYQFARGIEAKLKEKNCG
jgi:hypothetical protein